MALRITRFMLRTGRILDMPSTSVTYEEVASKLHIPTAVIKGRELDTRTEDGLGRRATVRVEAVDYVLDVLDESITLPMSY